jgi:hypothetical protein
MSADEPLRVGARAEQTLGGGVADRDDAIGIDAEHASGHAGEHRLDEGAPLVVERVRGGQAIALLAQLHRHLVEGLAEMAEVAFGAARRHLDVEIAGGDLVGGAYQASNRPDEFVGEGQAHPHRRDQHRQRQHHEDAGESQLDVAPVRLEIREDRRDLRGVSGHLV